MNGSKVTEMFPQVGLSQHTVDLNCPWKVSTTLESLRARWFVQASSATSASGLPAPSTAGTAGFVRIRFRSSCSPSSKNVTTCRTDASAWPWPPSYGRDSAAVLPASRVAGTQRTAAQTWRAHT
jgi:hypothetical protein